MYVTGRPPNGMTDGRTDGRTYPLIEMRERILKGRKMKRGEKTEKEKRKRGVGDLVKR